MADTQSDAAAAAAAAAANTYKKLKEDFVSNLSGGTSFEVFLVTQAAVIALFAWAVLQQRQSFFRPYTVLGFVVDFLLNVSAILLALTLYASQPWLLVGVLLAQTLFVFSLPRHDAGRPNRRPAKPKAAVRVATKTKSDTDTDKLDVLPKKPFLTSYRACMMVVTCVAILAVDFRVFPRRFAKVETWGTSVMDMGVGSFVFSAGVVAARPVLKERATGRVTPLATRLWVSLRHALPLFVLGIVRLLSVKGLDYAEHVTEYGVHWNFFFTLGLLPPFVAAAQSALKVVPSYALLALLLAGLYEVALDTTDLKAYALTAPRVDLISMNREGLLSFLGYLSIFLAGQDVGLAVLPRATPEKTAKVGKTVKTSKTGLARRWALAQGLRGLVVRHVVWHLLYHIVVCTLPPYGLGLTISRRLANLPYVLWVLTFNTMQLLSFAAVDMVVFPAFYEATDATAEAAAYDDATSPLLRAYNRNGLALFLLANLLTGLVNMTVPTLDVTPAVAYGILLGYGMLLSVVAVALDRQNITIKL